MTIMMKKGISLALAALMALSVLTGCGGQQVAAAPPETVAQTQSTQPASTIPVDGNPDDVTAKGSYTQSSPASGTKVAQVAGESLTNEELWVIYWLEVAAWRQSGQEVEPDYDAPLDGQSCPLDSSVNSWQQYFLRRALNTWHTAQALALQSVELGIPTEEAYEPNLKNHETYMTGIPAVKYLYGVNNNYHINTLHQAYLDAMPETLEALAKKAGYDSVSALAKGLAGASEKALESWAELYNTGYAYFTSLSYLDAVPEDPVPEETGEATASTQAAAPKETTAPTEETLPQETEAPVETQPPTGEKLVSVRQLLMIPQVPQPKKKKNRPEEETVDPLTLETVSVGEDGTVSCSQAMWDLGLEQARELVEEYEAAWKKNQASNSKTTREALFADFAHSRSSDTDTAPNGGLYRNLRQGQLTQALDRWCFDASRQPGDMDIVKTDCGYHILFYVGDTNTGILQQQTQAQQELLAQQLDAARERYPMTVTYSAIALTEGGDTQAVSSGDLLYGDVAHQRFPEVPLYLQQDYPKARYGNYLLRTHGCGITTMAMTASYLADQELTPPQLAKRYGKYCYNTGTDGSLFMVTPSEMGFYLKERTYEPKEAFQAMEEGHLVVCVQTKGYWTRGGHYLCLERLVDGLEDETVQRVQVRDSNIFNYTRLKDHAIDAFKWTTIPPDGHSYWIYEKKLTNISICTRCGDPNATTGQLLSGDYICEKCEPALIRRNAYLADCAQ